VELNLRASMAFNGGTLSETRGVGSVGFWRSPRRAAARPVSLWPHVGTRRATAVTRYRCVVARAVQSGMRESDRCSLRRHPIGRSWPSLLGLAKKFRGRSSGNGSLPCPFARGENASSAGELRRKSHPGSACYGPSPRFSIRNNAEITSCKVKLQCS
jgi:hypothetical protein